MRELLGQLDESSTILDLGCGRGSFPYEAAPGRIVALDEWVADVDLARRRMATGRVHYTIGSGVHLPLDSESADLVVANHVFEHLPDPEETAREVDRVLNERGVLYASIPDGYSFSDGLYRWCTGGGGHVQRYSFSGFQRLVESRTSLRLLYASPLYHAFTFLNPTREAAAHLPVSYQRLAGLPSAARRRLVTSANRILRTADALFGSRLSFYGWAFYFGKRSAILSDVPREIFINVCGFCGMGHSGPWLSLKKKVRRKLVLPYYTCEACGQRNPYFGRLYTQSLLPEPFGDPEYLQRPTKPPAQSDAPLPQHGEAVVSRWGDPIIGSPDFSPGALVELKGSGLSTGAADSRDQGWPLAAAGTQVLVNEEPVPLGSVEEGRILFQLPFTTPRGDGKLQVRSDGQSTEEIRFRVEIAAPALATVEGPRPQFGRFSHESWEPVTRESPARAGEVVVIWAVGLGPVAPTAVAGRPTSADHPPTVTRRPFFSVGGRLAEVQFCGLAPGSVGYYQINVRIRKDTPAGEHEAFIEIGGARSNVVRIPVGV